MKKAISFLLILASLLCMAGCEEGTSTDTTTTAVTTPAVTEPPTLTEQVDALEGTLTDVEAIKAARELVWEEYAAKIADKSPNRKKEIRKNQTTKIKIGGTTMKVMTRVVGSAPKAGYPLFLVYNGVGYNTDGQMNESQWSGMAERYDDVPGIYCSIRSVSDNESSGQIFSTDISWQFYDRIIENCILYMKANPKQVYIVGYSAGGNGVYQ
ncbi:MAG: hypothetical protein IJW62_03010, partial [Clostridia bacterium]|nr:hypothetical protein [Clostridia bacterium]